MMFKDQYKKELGQIAPSQDLISRTKAAMQAEMPANKQQHNLKAPKRPVFRKVAAFAAVAVILLAVFAADIFNQAGDIGSPFTIRAYAMELQPDGTYRRQEVDISHLYGWGEHYDGEVLHIGLGLWFEVAGENIQTVQLGLENGFFATQYIGNRGEVPHTTRWHISTPPDFTTNRLVMYGNDFTKVGNTITFGNVMPNDILLFWGSYDTSINDWWQGNRVIEIDVKVTFEDGEIHHQQLVLDFSDGWGVGWFDAGLL